MKRLWTRLLVIPALLLLVASEANAQRRGGFGVSVGSGGYRSPGFGYSTGYRGGFGYGYPGYGYGYNGFNRGFGYSPYYGGYGSGIAISLGNNWNRYGNYYGGYYGPGYSGYYSDYSGPTYSTAFVPMMSGGFSQPTYSTDGITQMSYSSPSYTTDSGVVQASGYSSSAVSAAAKVKLTVPERAEVWVDGKQAEGTGTTREFTTDALSSWTNVKLKIKDGDSTREFTMPVRPGEDSKVDLSPLLR